ncbi:MAG: alpha/beta hydrolase [Bacteroidota bacterium]
MPTSTYLPKVQGGHVYVDEGAGDAVVLLHGMLGGVENWDPAVAGLVKAGYRAVVPTLPVYDLPTSESNVSGLVTYLGRFLDDLELHDFVLGGNSLGGHVALLHAMEAPGRARALVLSGASGIYEVAMGTETMRRRDREFVRERAAWTFYDPRHATDELVDEMLALIEDRSKALRLIRMARSTQQETLTDRLGEIQVPTLLVWGTDDRITPIDVAHTFQEGLQQAQLVVLDQCGHAPMIEHPERFNEVMLSFLKDVEARAL